eukprot:m.367015 g.367015  ORF g.367015 m.367015 type:complete len:282 (+) comp16661_c1_seq8:143-988(+)
MNGQDDMVCSTLAHNHEAHRHVTEYLLRVMVTHYDLKLPFRTSTGSSLTLIPKNVSGRYAPKIPFCFGDLSNSGETLMSSKDLGAVAVKLFGSADVGSAVMSCDGVVNMIADKATQPDREKLIALCTQFLSVHHKICLLHCDANPTLCTNTSMKERIAATVDVILTCLAESPIVGDEPTFFNLVNPRLADNDDCSFICGTGFDTSTHDRIANCSGSCPAASADLGTWKHPLGEPLAQCGHNSGICASCIIHNTRKDESEIVMRCTNCVNLFRGAKHQGVTA